MLSWRVGQKFYVMNPNRERATRKGPRSTAVAQLRCDIHELIEVADSNGSDEWFTKSLELLGTRSVFILQERADIIVFIDGIDVDPSGSFGAELSDRAVYGGGGDTLNESFDLSVAPILPQAVRTKMVMLWRIAWEDGVLCRVVSPTSPLSRKGILSLA